MLKKISIIYSGEDKKMKGIVMPMSVVYDKSNKVICFAEHKKKIWIAAAFIGSFFGVTVGLAGLFFSFLAFLEPTELHSRLGGFLLIAVLPSFLLAAHAIDKIEDAEKVAKVEMLKKCRVTGTRF